MVLLDHPAHREHLGELDQLDQRVIGVTRGLLGHQALQGVKVSLDLRDLLVIVGNQDQAVHLASLAILVQQDKLDHQDLLVT